MKAALLVFLLPWFSVNAEVSSWFPWAMAQIDQIDSKPVEERIKLLGTFTGISAEPMNEEQAEVSKRAQSLLLNLPGHAEYYSKRINDARQRLDDNRKNHRDESRPLYELTNEQMYGFRVLGSLPSPETVRVLGEWLSDERGSNPKEIDREAGEAPNSSFATRALTRLPIVSKPVTVPFNRIYDSNIESVKHTWLLWYQQVKAGTRTFRFEGDPNEYSLAGPVKPPASAPPTDRSSRTDSASLAATQQPGHSSIPAPVIAIAATVLAAGAWYAWRAKKQPPQIG